MIESPVFYQHLSARENLELHCGYMGAGHERIGETLAMLGLSETGGKAVGKFSLGMKQRLAIARAFLTRPGAAHSGRANQRFRPPGYS